MLQYVPMIFNTVGDRQLEGLAWERIVGTSVASVTPETPTTGTARGDLGAEANSYLDAGDAVKALKARPKGDQ